MWEKAKSHATDAWSNLRTVGSQVTVVWTLWKHRKEIRELRFRFETDEWEEFVKAMKDSSSLDWNTYEIKKAQGEK